jgi:hypothetical protein
MVEAPTRRLSWTLMSWTRSLLCLLPALCWACGAAQPAALRRNDGCTGSPQRRARALEVYVEVDRAGQRTPLCPGQPLVGADALWVSVELETASYVRMVFVTPDGETGELLRQDIADLTREALFRAPKDLVSRALGEAELFIVATHVPLEQADPGIAAMFDVIRETGVIVDRDGSIRPPRQDPPQPSEGLRLDVQTHTLYADFDDKGVALLSLPLRAKP